MPPSDAGPHRYFLARELPQLVRGAARAHGPGVVVDLGAGDGGLLYALELEGLIGETAYAVDVSEERLAFCATLSPKIETVLADATSVPLPDGVADGVVCTQVIEHLADDRLLAPEIARLLKPGGWLYVASILRGPGAWWIYRREGHTVLDPTHVREYQSEPAFRAALEHPALELGTVRSGPLRFPVLDLALRALAFTRVVSFASLPGLYERAPVLATALRKIRIPVPGYRLVEAVGRKADDPR
jgi:SAM-dependent methyltransferase